MPLIDDFCWPPRLSTNLIHVTNLLPWQSVGDLPDFKGGDVLTVLSATLPRRGSPYRPLEFARYSWLARQSWFCSILAFSACKFWQFGWLRSALVFVCRWFYLRHPLKARRYVRCDIVIFSKALLSGDFKKVIDILIWDFDRLAKLFAAAKFVSPSLHWLLECLVTTCALGVKFFAEFGIATPFCCAKLVNAAFTAFSSACSPWRLMMSSWILLSN